jgi:hypothetical protein
VNYFNPSDVTAHNATFNYIAKSGVGFALTPENEQIFIPVREVEGLNLSIGDGLRVWAVDNHANPDTAHYPSRWRAIKVELVSRISDVLETAPAPKPTQPEPKPSVGDFVAMFESMVDVSRPWTVNELTLAIAKISPPLSAQPDLLQRVSTRLNALHKTGDVACLKVYSKSDNDRASAVYYAKSVDVFYDYLDTPLNDDEE